MEFSGLPSEIEIGKIIGFCWGAGSTLGFIGLAWLWMWWRAC